jgi:hypothetical protein
MTRGRWIRVGAYAAFAVLAILVAYWRIYAKTTNDYGDEGYVLLSVKEFVRSGGLYGHVYSQYGPFPYELWGALYRLLGWGVTPDNARQIVIAVWLLIGVLIGITVERVSGSLPVGLIAAMVGFRCCEVLADSVLIPDGLAIALEASIAATAAFVTSRPRVRAVLFAALIAALLLTKINSGGAALLAVAVAVSASWSGVERRVVVGLSLAACVALPFVITSRDVGQSPALDLTALIALGAAGVGLVITSQTPPPTAHDAHGEAACFVIALAGTLLFLAGVIVLTGTTPAELIRGVVTGPVQNSKAFRFPFEPPVSAIALAALGFGSAIVVTRAPGIAPDARTGGLLRIVLGALMLSAAAAGAASRPSPDLLGFTVSLPFLWLVASPPQPAQLTAGQSLVRILLAILPLTCAIVAYPVAGLQVGYGTTLIVPAAAVIVSDGAQQLRTLGSRRGFRVPINHAVGSGLVAIVGYLLLVGPAVSEAGDYGRMRPLPFPGATHVRARPSDVRADAGLVATIRARCDQFLTFPGLNNFYLWAKVNPPTGLNVTDWVYLLSASEQRRVVDAVKPVGRLCLVSDPAVEAFWEAFGPGRPPARPLLQYVRTGFTPIYRAGGYVISVRTS